MSSDVTSRYKSAYEERMNPFIEFGEKVQIKAGRTVHRPPY